MDWLPTNVRWGMLVFIVLGVSLLCLTISMGEEQQRGSLSIFGKTAESLSSQESNPKTPPKKVPEVVLSPARPGSPSCEAQSCSQSFGSSLSSTRASTIEAEYEIDFACLDPSKKDNKAVEEKRVQRGLERLAKALSKTFEEPPVSQGSPGRPSSTTATGTPASTPGSSFDAAATPTPARSCAKRNQKH